MGCPRWCLEDSLETPYAGRMTVEMRHLRALAAIDETESFTVAAAVLGTTQPTLSRTIAQLETLVGTKLVDRTTRKVVLTERGIEFALEASSLVGRLDRLLERFAGDADILRLGWAWGGLGKHTHALIRAWQGESQTPIEAIRPDDLETALDRAEIDIAIVKRATGEPRAPEGRESRLLFRESLVAAVAVANPLAASPHLSLDEIAHHTVALCSVSPTASLRLWDEGPTTPQTLMAGNTDEWLMNVVLDRAVGITSAATAFSHTHPEVVYRDIDDSPEVEVTVEWTEDSAHRSSSDFADFAQRYFRRITGTS